MASFGHSSVVDLFPVFGRPSFLLPTLRMFKLGVFRYTALTDVVFPLPGEQVRSHIPSTSVTLKHLP